MREIKFRAKRVDNGEWIYGDLIYYSAIDPFTYIAKGAGYKVDDPEIGKSVKVLPDTVGQLTGLKDKNGVEIYEGDICTYNFGYESDFPPQKIWFERGSFKYGISSIYDMGRDFEVVGNIYENPELLHPSNDTD